MRKNKTFPIILIIILISIFFILVSYNLTKPSGKIRNYRIDDIKEGIDFLFVADDIAYKSGLFIQPAIFKPMWLPKLKRILEPLRLFYLCEPILILNSLAITYYYPKVITNVLPLTFTIHS